MGRWLSWRMYGLYEALEMRWSLKQAAGQISEIQRDCVVNVA